MIINKTTPESTRAEILADHALSVTKLKEIHEKLRQEISAFTSKSGTEAKAIAKANRDLKQVERIANRLQRQIDRTKIDE